MTKPTIASALADARHAIAQALPECSEDALELDRTGVLPDGPLRGVVEAFQAASGEQRPEALRLILAELSQAALRAAAAAGTHPPDATAVPQVLRLLEDVIAAAGLSSDAEARSVLNGLVTRAAALQRRLRVEGL